MQNHDIKANSDISSSPVNRSYPYALTHLAGLTSRTALRLLTICPSQASWANLTSSQERELILLLKERANGVMGLNWRALNLRADEEIERHANLQIDSVAITEDRYPWPLKLIKDPPVILFVKGTLEEWSKLPGVAIIGTRNTTRVGESVARKVAREFAQEGACIVSGLAKGIDAAGHSGALDARKPTVAVFATPLDKIYPAENRELAYRIIDGGGAWVSEIPLGKATHRNSFVERDRIQSGLSIAVVPVQTDIKGGTMHTVQFAKQQHRLLLCPRPPAPETTLDQYRGIHFLIDRGDAEAFSSGELPDVTRKIWAHLKRLDRSEHSVPDAQASFDVIFREPATPLPQLVLQMEVVKDIEAVTIAEKKPKTAPIRKPRKTQTLSEKVRKLFGGVSSEEFDLIVASVRSDLFQPELEEPSSESSL